MDLEEVRHTIPFLSEEYKLTIYCNYRKQCIYPERNSTTKIKQTKKNKPQTNKTKPTEATYSAPGKVVSLALLWFTL